MAMVDQWTPAPAEPAVEDDMSSGSPMWWRGKLLEELAVRERRVSVLEAWYDGRHPLPAPPDRMTRYAEAASAFRALSRMGITNYLSLVPDAAADRLRVVGFRFGDVTKMRDDNDAWKLWQENDLDADSGLVQSAALEVGSSLVLVWPSATIGAEITVEHAGQAIVGYVPGSRRKRAAGLKCWCEEDGSRRVVLYMPEKVYKWTSSSENGALVRWRPETDDSWPIANPFASRPEGERIPLVEFRANPKLRPSPMGGGSAEFAGVISIQRRINKTVFDRLVTAEFQAFRQRWAVGWEPNDPNQGLEASMRNLLTFKDSDVKLGEFAQADFTGFLKGVESDVQAMAAITRTPTFYTLGSISNISGETLTALQAGLVAKCEAHRDNFGEDWEEVLELALFAANKDHGSADSSSMVVWRSIEHVSWAERADAAVKMAAVNVPDEGLWELLGFSPQEIQRFRVMRADQQLFAPEAALPAPIVSPTGAVRGPSGTTPKTGAEPMPGMTPPAPGPAANGSGAH